MVAIRNPDNIRVGQIWYEIEPTKGNKKQVEIVRVMGGSIFVKATDDKVYRVPYGALAKTHALSKQYELFD